MLSVRVMGRDDARRIALEERIAAIEDLVVVPRQPLERASGQAADVLIVAADRAAFDETRRMAARASVGPPPMLVVVDEPFEELLSVLWLGARGIVLASASDRELADCATLVAHRCTVVPERLLSGGRPVGGGPPFGWVSGQGGPRAALDRLSPREMEVLKLAGSGRTNAEIAQRLWLSSNTVRSHVQRIMRKLGLRSRLCLIIFVHELGLLDPAGGAEGEGDSVSADGRSHPVPAPEEGPEEGVEHRTR